MIWTTRRKILGNAIPLAFGILTLIIFHRYLMIASVLSIIATHIGINQFGFFDNSKIQEEMQSPGGELIGFVAEVPPSIFDAHAEIGILNMNSKKLLIKTENREVVILKKNILGISRKPNIHWLIGLGGWVAITLRDNKVIKLESRQYRTMWQSKKRTDELFTELKNWMQKDAPEQKAQGH
jgi:hypothetical protein